MLLRQALRLAFSMHSWLIFASLLSRHKKRSKLEFQQRLDSQRSATVMVAGRKVTGHGRFGMFGWTLRFAILHLIQNASDYYISYRMLSFFHNSCASNFYFHWSSGTCFSWTERWLSRYDWDLKTYVIGHGTKEVQAKLYYRTSQQSNRGKVVAVLHS